MNNFNCLMYHEINDHGDKYAIRKDAFLAQLDYLIANDFKGRSIRDMRKNPTYNTIVITFDDGFVSDVWAGEELAKLGFTATFYLVEDFIKNTSNKYMNESQVKQLTSMGHEIGIHGKNHDAWPAKPINTLLNELIATQEWLQKLTISEITSCSAPGGKINKDIVKALYDNNHFKNVRNSMPWYNTYDAFEINSIAILEEDSVAIFAKKASGDAVYYYYLYIKYEVKKLVKKLLRK